MIKRVLDSLRCDRSDGLYANALGYAITRMSIDPHKTEDALFKELSDHLESEREDAIDKYGESSNLVYTTVARIGQARRNIKAFDVKLKKVQEKIPETQLGYVNKQVKESVLMDKINVEKAAIEKYTTLMKMAVDELAGSLAKI